MFFVIAWLQIQSQQKGISDVATLNKWQINKSCMINLIAFAEIFICRLLQCTAHMFLEFGL